MKKTLHIISFDEFTIPFIHFVNKEFDPNDHVFICCSNLKSDISVAGKNVEYQKSPFRKNILGNTILFYNNFQESSKIILHGNPQLFYSFLFSWSLKKTYWVIYGYELGFITNGKSVTKKKTLQSFIKNFVLKRVFGHISHIRGDSDLANAYFKSTGKFYYSPVYLSNVVNKYNIKNAQIGNPGDSKKILVGNSTSPTNDHASIFQMLLSYKNDNIIIYCPLSYGDFPEYRDNVISLGKKLFGNKFIPIQTFMKLGDYMNFLETIDVAIFNHQRQEAMGITLQLLNFGKVVYMNSQTSSYRSFIERGIIVFDNAEIMKGGLYEERNVSNNSDLVYSYYNYQVLKKSWFDIFKQ